MGDAPTAAAATPKLLELDKEDVKAVRSFLPGKVLGRTAALLALVVLVLGFAGSLDVAVERFLGFPLEPPWLKYAVLIGLPVLIVGAQIAAEWTAERKRKQAQALAVKIEAVPEGYFRIGPYLDTPDDRAKFDRADRAHEKVLAWLKRADATPLYLTGDSGSGKSSVLNAYALPELRAAGWTVIEARAWQDPEAALSAAIAKLAAARKWKLREAKTLRERLDIFARRADDKLLLVLDQFEEFVILAGSDTQKAFTAFTEDLRLKPIKGLKLLLVLRSDYTTALEDVGLPPQRKGENWQEIGRFTTGAGTKFMARSGLALEQIALDRLATSASELDDSPGMIRPITLNVVGYVLSQGGASAPSLDAGQLVRHYIEQSVEQPAIREFAPRVLGELVTEQGTKRPRSEQELVDQTGLRPGEVRAVMNGLWTAALARPLDAAQGVWELSHDFVARAVARYLGRRRLDWPGLTPAFAAPALFGLMAAAVVGAMFWNAGAADRLRAQLSDFGIDVSSDGLEAAASPRFKNGRVRMGRLTTLESMLSMPDVVDLAPLKGLTALHTLDLSGTQVADLAPLKGLTALHTLNLSGTPVADLAPLEGLTALETLDLSGAGFLADLAPLKGLTALRTLYLSGTNVADLAPLTGLTGLQSLDLSLSQVRDLANFKGLSALEELNLSNTRVTDLAPLKGLTALQTLYLSNTQVADLPPLNGLTALQTLDFSNTQVADLAPLKDLTGALQTLFLQHTNVADLGPLKGLTGLRTLYLSGTNVADLAPLKGLTALQALGLAGTKIADLAALKGSMGLRTLDLTGTRVADLAPLKDLTALYNLDLSYTQVADLTPVHDLPNLTVVSGLSDAQLQELNAYRASRKLPPVRSEL
jgi:Leucine-rich repeat (LRR) protein